MCNTISLKLFLLELYAFVFLSNFIYVFLAVLGLRCCADLSPIVEGGCSLFAAHRLLIVVASLIERPGLYSIGSTVVGQGLTCSAACGIFPDQGWSPCFLHWQADPLPLRHHGSPPLVFVLFCFYR